MQWLNWWPSIHRKMTWTASSRNYFPPNCSSGNQDLPPVLEPTGKRVKVRMSTGTYSKVPPFICCAVSSFTCLLIVLVSVVFGCSPSWYSEVSNYRVNGIRERLDHLCSLSTLLPLGFTYDTVMRDVKDHSIMLQYLFPWQCTGWHKKWTRPWFGLWSLLFFKKNGVYFFGYLITKRRSVIPSHQQASSVKVSASSYLVYKP